MVLDPVHVMLQSHIALTSVAEEARQRTKAVEAYARGERGFIRTYPLVELAKGAIEYQCWQQICALFFREILWMLLRR